MLTQVKASLLTLVWVSLIEGPGRGGDDHSHFPEESSLPAGVRGLLFPDWSPGWGDPMYIFAVTPPTASQNHPRS